VRFQVIILSILLLASASYGQNQPQVEEVVQPAKRLTKNWVFVIDTSISMNGVFHKAVEGLRHLTQAPTDEWHFSAIVFNNAGQERWFRPRIDKKRKRWVPASVDTFNLAEAWLDNTRQRGVNSHGLRALEWALKSKRKDLTVIVIGDGGFTSACENRGFGKVRKTIATGQAWRVVNGWGRALITTVGVANSHYSIICARCVRGKRAKTRHNYSIRDFWETNIGKKPSDVDCQGFLQEIGTTYEGGYLHVRHVKQTVHLRRLKHGLNQALHRPSATSARR